jgi:hypothetical protein
MLALTHCYGVLRSIRFLFDHEYHFDSFYGRAMFSREDDSDSDSELESEVSSSILAPEFRVCWHTDVRGRFTWSHSPVATGNVQSMK